MGAPMVFYRSKLASAEGHAVSLDELVAGFTASPDHGEWADLGGNVHTLGRSVTAWLSDTHGQPEGNLTAVVEAIVEQVMARQA